MTVVPQSAPRTNRTLSEMVPERRLTLALERLLVRRPEGILANPFERGEMGPDLFSAASSSTRRLGSNCFIPARKRCRDQILGTKAPVRTLEG
jgi:hypothetical protein